MTWTIEISTELEAQLRTLAQREDEQAMHRLLLELLAPQLESLIAEDPAAVTQHEMDRGLDELADTLDAGSASAPPVLSDEARKRLKGTVWGLEKVGSISELMDLCRADR